MASQPFELVTRASLLRCAYCHETDRGELEICECGSAMHRECRELLGRCTTLGCKTARAPSRDGFSWFGPIAGIALPLVCLALDPIVFRDGAAMTPNRRAIFGEYAVPAYAFMAVEMTALAIALGAQPRSRLLAVLLWAGALFATLLGVVLVPLSIAGIAAGGMGLLGFTPFFTAVAFYRAGRACFRRAPPAPRVHTNKAP